MDFEDESIKKILESYDKKIIQNEISKLAENVASKIINKPQKSAPNRFVSVKCQLQDAEDNLRRLREEKQSIEILKDVLNARIMDIDEETVAEEKIKTDLVRKIAVKREAEEEQLREAEAEARDRAEKERLRAAQLCKLEEEKKARIDRPSHEGVQSQIPAFFGAPSSTATSDHPVASQQVNPAVPGSSKIKNKPNKTSRGQQRMGEAEEEAILQTAIDNYKKTGAVWSKDLSIPGVERRWHSLRKKAIRLIQQTTTLKLERLGMSHRQATNLKDKCRNVKT